MSGGGRSQPIDVDASVADKPDDPPTTIPKLTEASRATLITPLAWLDDAVIDAWMNLVASTTNSAAGNDQVAVITSHLFTALQDRRDTSGWLTKANLANKTLLIPFVYRKHWTLGVMKDEDGQMVLNMYNSSEGYYKPPTGRILTFLTKLLRLPRTPGVVYRESPQQINGDDCGVMICVFAACLVRARPAIGTDVGHMTETARSWMDACLREGVLRYHPRLLPAPIRGRPATASAPSPIDPSPTTYPNAPPISATAVRHGRMRAVEPEPGSDLGDEEDDDEEDMERFAQAILNPPLVPSGHPPPYKSKAEVHAEHRETTHHKPIVSPVRDTRHPNATNPCTVCGKQVHSDTACRTCRLQVHPQCACFGKCMTCFRGNATPSTNEGSGKNGNNARTAPTTKDTCPTPCPKPPRTPNLKESPGEAHIADQTSAPSMVQATQGSTPTRMRRRRRRPPPEVHVHMPASPPDFQDGRAQRYPAVVKGAQLLASMVFVEDPGVNMEMAWKGIGASTRKSHQRHLKLMQAALLKHHDLASEPVPLVCIKVLLRARAALGWSHTTLAKHAGSVAGAMARLDQYLCPSDQHGPVSPIQLAQYSIWQDFMREATRQARMAKTRIPQAATALEVTKVMHRLVREGKRFLAVTLWLGWTHAARPSDVWRLERHDVVMEGERLTITWRRGKVVASRGPYSTFAAMGEFAGLLSTFLNSFPPSATMFLTAGPWKSASLLKELRATNRQLELRSLRRGALQLLSTMGTPEEILMIFSGHSSIATLRRYLGYQPAAEVAERCILASVGMLRKDSPPEPDTSSTITVDARPRRSSLAYTRTCTETGPSTRRT